MFSFFIKNGSRTLNSSLWLLASAIIEIVIKINLTKTYADLNLGPFYITKDIEPMPLITCNCQWTHFQKIRLIKSYGDQNMIPWSLNYPIIITVSTLSRHKTDKMSFSITTKNRTVCFPPPADVDKCQEILDPPTQRLKLDWVYVSVWFSF